ncbi:MAG: hypothetical protein GY765_43970 [bacterium]|nr:hypothetical protein [bacterium]
MKNKKTLTKIVIFSTLLMAIGIFFIVHSYFNNPVRIITRAIESKKVAENFNGNRTAVYLIDEVNTGCRSCSKFDALQKDPGVRIIFYVPADYSDIDIANFRESFHIPEKYAVRQITGGWLDVFESCNSGEENKDNLLILVNEKQKVTRLWRF